ncbi:hypothetical protein I545_6527 [Mycobacterium kansasii 662]|uniref:Uncharacterized protein n=2 Tax=Mycobacterium kansasii TaxID=1768 RepID=A0A1V3WBM9_MYCKA|nr:hypothetical protein I547_7146 [Mycobacterium kansasii 824]EUA06006.1 hypothetical protein I545_6527 [Mycobacterium kansasii 662]KEP41433.1 hypothetical protein MKSMC1_34190 [Mycobacterium kansasii]OOK64394.1 hypothetical protein BZL29_8305 [Mycobacterium kansasii]
MAILTSDILRSERSTTPVEKATLVDETARPIRATTSVIRR